MPQADPRGRGQAGLHRGSKPLASGTTQSPPLRPGQQHFPTVLQPHGKSVTQVQVSGDRQGREGVVPSKPKRAASHVLPRRNGPKLQFWNSRHKPINKDKEHCPGALPSFTLPSACLQAVAQPPELFALRQRDEDQVQLLADSLWLHPIPQRQERRKMLVKNATTGTTGLTPQEEPKSEGRCWRLPGSIEQE